METLVVLLILSAVFGGVSAAIASAKGRNAVGWFFLAFACGLFTFGILGIVPIIVVACINNVNEEQALFYRQEMENRRLREMLRQERMKSEVFREHTQRRLDAHDEVLGVETRIDRQLTGGAPQGALPMSQLNALPGIPAPGPDGAIVPLPDQGAPVVAYGGQGQSSVVPAQLQSSPAQWYYEYFGTSVGPVSEEVIRTLIASGRLPLTSLVWCQDMVDWTPAAHIPQFSNAVRT